jgi:hypothetical protein
MKKSIGLIFLTLLVFGGNKTAFVNYSNNVLVKENRNETYILENKDEINYLVTQPILNSIKLTTISTTEGIAIDNANTGLRFKAVFNDLDDTSVLAGFKVLPKTLHSNPTYGKFPLLIYFKGLVINGFNWVKGAFHNGKSLFCGKDLQT